MKRVLQSCVRRTAAWCRRTRSCANCIPARLASPYRPLRKVSACRSWRRWRAASPCWLPPQVRCRKPQGTRQCCCRRSTCARGRKHCGESLKTSRCGKPCASAVSRASLAWIRARTLSRCSNLLDDCAQALDETPGRERFRMAAQALPIVVRRIEIAQAPRKRFRRGFVEELAGLALDDRFERPARAQRDRRSSARRRLERKQTEIFFARQNRRAGITEQFVHPFVGDEAEHRRRRSPRLRAQRGFGGSGAGDQQAYARRVRRADRHIDALVRQKAGRDEKIVAGAGTDREPIEIDRAVQHECFA